MESVIRTALEDALGALGIEGVHFSVEHPSDMSHGDYATNAALVAAKQAGKNPRELAEQIAAELEDEIEYVEQIKIAGPGFINFHLAPEFFTEEIRRIAQLKENWGRSGELEDEVILFEYTSPNLFKPLHIGNLVGNIIGESLTRLLACAGADVKRINYPSDIGLTVAKGVWGLQKTGGNPDDIAALGEAYRFGNEAYENDESAKSEIETVNRALYAGDDTALLELRERGLKTSRARLAELCQKLGTKFDAEIPESEAGPIGKEIVESHIADGVFKESGGAVVFEGEKHGLHTRVFLNSQGLPTYEAKDLGNFIRKNDLYPAWTSSFIVTGGEQKEYFKVLIAAAREIFPEAKEKHFEHIGTGFLTLTTGKMSSRKGNVLTGESLLAELEAEARNRAAETRAENIDALAEMIAVAALKYQILRQSIGSDIVFNKEQALSFEGDSGPYLQYTYARTRSVMKKAADSGIHAAVEAVPAHPYGVERVIYQFEEVVKSARDAREPHHLVTYLTALAGAFNAFYAHEKIADPKDLHAGYKLLLTEAVAVTLKNGLYLLGIKAPEQM